MVDSEGNELSNSLVSIVGNTFTLSPTSQDYSTDETINAAFRVNLPAPHVTPADFDFDLFIKHPCINAMFVSKTVEEMTTTVAADAVD